MTLLLLRLAALRAAAGACHAARVSHGTAGHIPGEFGTGSSHVFILADLL